MIAKCLWHTACVENGRYINFQPIDNLEQSVVDDAEYTRNHPLAASNIPIYGYSYDVNTGRLIEAKKATEIGRAK